MSRVSYPAAINKNEDISKKKFWNLLKTNNVAPKDIMNTLETLE